MTWYYQGQPLTETPAKYVGFVYEIQDLSNGKKYIGKKLFWASRKKKGKRVKVESDWQNYYGSSKNLNENRLVEGDNNYYRSILRMCLNRSEMSYFEAKEQFDRDVLLRDDYYNEFIGCKINSRGLKNIDHEEL